MKKTSIALLICFSLIGVFLLPDASQAASYNLEKIFYLAPYNAVKGVASVQQNWQNIDILAPQYYSVNADFTVSGKFGPKLTQVIKDHNIKVMPLVVNAGFSQKLIHSLLISPSGQSAVINALVAIGKSQNYIGWQFDFENINYQDKDLFTTFVQKAYPIFQQNHLMFSVAVIPRTTDYEDTDAFKNWGGAYDYAKIAASTDFVSLMTYDDSNSVGPTASVVFIDNVLAYVKGKIPPQKLSLGIPLYYWKWSVAEDKKVGTGSYANVMSIMDSVRYVLGFDTSLGVPWLTYFFHNQQYKIWFEDRNSFQAKLDIVKNNNLRGFSAWVLGSEDSAIWKTLSNTQGS